MKITKEEFYSLYSEDISKKSYDNIIIKINHRVDEVWRDILNIQGIKLDWYDYDNGGGRDNDGDPINGNFVPELYEEDIGFTGEWSGNVDYDKPYNNYIPTKFLWEDYEEKVLEDIKSYKENKERKKIENTAKRLELKERRKVMIESIKSKLTKEELRFIKFKGIK